MASLIPGYEYDVFISYRQKDNEYDGWVTEFVNNLKKELHATFKEEISVYFDANPQDGLLETHVVHESLSKKLKTLIFIPIISQTYCDPKSFAWQSELCAFNKAAMEDQFGRDIIVSGGNVASRILPVKIHELDNEDRILLEKELGGALRCIEFIYKSVGVNRPLRSNEDHPNDNLNKTYYRDQINKVANAIKEVINGLQKPGQSLSQTEDKEQIMKPAQKRRVPSKTIIALAVLLVLIALSIITVNNILNSVKSLAILPFYNDSPNDSADYIIMGFEEAVRDNLQAIGDLRVVNRTSVEQYRNNRNRSIPEIARKLRVKNIVEGSAQISGGNMHLVLRLIKAKKREERIWGKPYTIKLMDPVASFETQSLIAKEIAGKLSANITLKEEQILDKDNPTEDRAAYDCFLIGQTYMQKLTRQDLITATRYFEMALEKDPDFALAFAGLSDTWLAMGSNGYVPPDVAGQEAIKASWKALEIDSTLYQVHYSLGLISYIYNWDWTEAEKDFRKAISLNPNHAESLAHYANLLNITGRSKEAQKYIEKAVELDPLNNFIKAIYSINLLFTREYEDAVVASSDALEMDPTNPISLFANAFALQKTGRLDESLKVWKESLLNTMKSYENEYNIKIAHAFDRGYKTGGFIGSLRAEADTLMAQLKEVYFNPTEISTLLLAAGGSSEVLDLLNKAYDMHDPNVIYVLLPLYDNLRNNTDFQELCKNMSLPWK
jgi:adenylate cyclase